MHTCMDTILSGARLGLVSGASLLLALTDDGRITFKEAFPLAQWQWRSTAFMLKESPFNYQKWKKSLACLIDFNFS